MKSESPESHVKKLTESGLLVMMAMMMVCCVGIFVIVALIPVVGWPAGAVIAILVGVGLMYAHQRIMRHCPRD